MLYSLILKEHLKLKWLLLVSLFLNLGLCLKIFLDIRQLIRTEHAEMVWYQAIHLHAVFYQDVRYLMVLAGVVLAAAQFVPEVLGRRMRIALHLPIDRHLLLLCCLLVGLSYVAVVALMDLLLIYVMLRHYFPVEVALASLSTMLPWVLAALMAYLGTVNLLLVSAWPRRVALFLVFGALIAILFSGTGYAWLKPALPWLLGLVPLALLTVFESLHHFQQRSA